MKTLYSRPAWRRLGGVLLPGVALVVVGACDFDVTNPGPTQDVFLDSLNAHNAIVIGARSELGNAMEEITYWGAAITHEINPAGSTGSFGIPTSIQDGRFTETMSQDYTFTSRARWTAEQAFVRFQTVLPLIEGAPDINAYDPAGTALLYAGYANRLLGENFCQITFDGGAPVAHTDAYVRAEGHFTQAMAIASAAGNTDVATAAQAGRASIRANLATYGLGSWSDAAADASAIADDYVFVMPYSEQDQDQFNYINFANGNEPYRAHTVWATFWHEYFTVTQDPRVPWILGVCPDCPDPLNPTGDAGVDKFGGQVPWFTQMKFDATNSPINLSSGWEMRLIEAEAALAGSDFAGADVLMNGRISALNTAGATIATAASASVAEGYAKLYLERGAELWLEGRRMGDVRRWIENAAPGAPTGAGQAGAFTDGVYLDTDMDTFFDDQVEFVVDNHRAYPIGQSEREVNTSVDITVAFCTT